MSQVKFCVFADLHHYPGVFCTDAPKRLAAILARAEKEQADCVISLGDFCHSPTRYPEIIRQFEASPVPHYHVMGNHDTDGDFLANVLSLYKMPGEYYFFDLKGFRFILLDTDYYRWHNGVTHYEHRNYFDFPHSRETMPQAELDWLEETLQSSPYPCLLFSHASLERHPAGGGGVRNHDEIMAILRRSRNSGHKVLLACNGHHHRNALRILENTAFFDVNSASFDWLNQGHEFFPENLRNEFDMVDHQVIFSEVLSAMVTVSDDGTIEIEGSRSGFLHDIRREMTGNPVCDGAGRPCEAEILSAKFRLL